MMKVWLFLFVVSR